MIEIFILSIIQGISEFLPVSSSSHLILASSYLDYNNENLSIDVSLHIGSFFAVLIYFRNEIFYFFKNKDLFLKIIAASIPTMIIGYILVKYDLIDKLRSVEIIGWTTLIFGILMYFSDKFKNKNKLKINLSYKAVFFIGLMQVLSLIPGVSRSGVTITAARFLNFKRFDSAKISFLFSIPILAAVSFFGLSNIVLSNDLQFTFINFTSIFLSFIFSFLTIKYFLKYVESFSLTVFVIYRVILGIIILAFAYF
jgi:undecaprenyl-diphosphatase